jgi:gluconate 5-dehydrogenase
MDHFRLDGTLALITGASRGIGRGVALAMAEAGADVILAARASADLDEAAEEVRTRTGRTVHTAGVDLQDTAAIPAWYDELVARVGRPNALVNAAGITRRAPAEVLALQDWNDVIGVNLTASFLIAQAFARHLIGAGEPGRIINIASLMTAAARKTTTAYTASKGGVGQLTKALAVDWAEKGILVNAIAPGFIATSMTQPLKDNAEFDAWILKRTPLGRWGAPEDIALPAVFLASSAAKFVTGQVIYVDGGFMATF